MIGATISLPAWARRWAARATICSSLCAVCGWLPARVQIFGSPQTAAPSIYIVGRMGIEMSESAARHGVAFRPFTPPRRVVASALLPPFHGDDTRANRGIGFEYADEKGRLYALAQWPANGGTIDAFPLLSELETGCFGARRFRRGAKPSGIVWSTPHGLIMTLQSDGNNGAPLQAEWKKLVRRGACR